MKLWYQSVTREGAFPAYRATLVRLLQSAAGDGVEIDVHGIRRQGGTGDPYRYLAFLQTVEILENVHRAQEEGYDAFLIGNLFNPGLREAREIADIPILALGEATLQVAETMGERIGFVSINRKFEPRLQDVIRSRRMTEMVAGVASMDVPTMAALEEAGSSGPAIDALLRNFMRAAEETVTAGAEVVVAAGGVVMAIVSDQGCFKTPSAAPIIHGVAALVGQAKAAVELRRQMDGVYGSPVLTYAKPGAPEIGGYRVAYGQRVYPGVKEDDAS